MSQQQRDIIDYLQEENRVLRQQLKWQATALFARDSFSLDLPLISRGVRQRVFIEELMILEASQAAAPVVKAVVMAAAISLHTKVAGMNDADPVTEAHLRQAERDLQRFIQNGTAPRRSAAAPPVMAPI